MGQGGLERGGDGGGVLAIGQEAEAHIQPGEGGEVTVDQVHDGLVRVRGWG